jgi:hypothetical protein
MTGSRPCIFTQKTTALNSFSFVVIVLVGILGCRLWAPRLIREAVILLLSLYFFSTFMADWKQVVFAGFVYDDRLCDRFGESGYPESRARCGHFDNPRTLLARTVRNQGPPTS